jgi:hypothetical protein
MGTGECVPQQLKNWRAPLKTLKHLSISYKKSLTPMKYGIDESVKQKYQLLPNQDKDNSEKHQILLFCLQSYFLFSFLIPQKLG